MAKIDEAFDRAEGGGGFLDEAGFFEHLNETVSRIPFYYPARRRLRKVHPRNVMNHGVWAVQRARRGWADCDTWSVDSYITRVTGDMLMYMARTTHSYPGDGSEWDTPEKWEAHLRDLATRLRVWNNDTFADKESYEVTQKAMEEFGRNLGHYWD